MPTQTFIGLMSGTSPDGIDAALHGLPAKVPGATGARASLVIGKVVPGVNYRGTRLG